MKYPKNNEITKDVKFTLYINAIGKKSNGIMDEIMNSVPWLRNPRILKTNYGQFRAVKYSYVLKPEDFYEVKELVRCRAIYGHRNEVLYLVEDNRNIFIFDSIKY